MKRIFYFILLTGFLFGCDSLLNEQKPQNSVDPSLIFKDAAGARSAIIGAYDNFQSASYYGVDFLLLPEVHSLNLTHPGTFPSYEQFVNRGILTDNANVTNMWAQIYVGINRVNQILDKVPGITDPALSAVERDQILGEAYFIRAFNYHNLVKYWGGVPLKLTPSDSYDPAKIVLPRASASEVYTQILADLALAIPKLPASPSTRSRATQAAANALKARVHLYLKQYPEAINAATLASTGYSLVPNFLDLWVLRNQSEAIFELQFNTVDTNSLAFYLLPSSNGGRNEVRPSAGLSNAYSATDSRRVLTTSIDSKLRYYRAATRDDNVILLRLAEMILTRAEALVERNTGTDLADAVVLVNLIRNRALIGNYAGAVTQAAVRDEVFLQRRLELAIEGHYFFDLVRTGRATTTLSSPTWNDNQALLPIPLREINAGGGVVTQNPGY